MRDDFIRERQKPKPKMSTLILELLLIIVLMVVIPMLSHQQSKPEPLRVAAPAADQSPYSMRKFMNLNGSRYAFLENGAAYAVLETLLGESLGVLSLDIQANPQENGQAELATTYAMGGEVYALNTYDKRFRVAVKLDGQVYLAEQVAHLDGTPLDLVNYFDQAKVHKYTELTQILDHGKREVLRELTKKQTEQLLQALEQSAAAALTDEEYQAVGHAQTEGKSFYVQFVLADETTFGGYVVPELGLVMFGDDRYRLPENFGEACGALFSGLTQQPLPMMG